MREISSVGNPLVKFVERLRDAHRRKKEGLFVVEGERCVRALLESGFSEVEQVVWSEERLTPQERQLLHVLGECCADAEWVKVSGEVMDRLSVREKRGFGVLVLAKLRYPGLAGVISAWEAGPFVVVVGFEKPGNLGAVMRTAAAAGVPVLVCDPVCDPFNHAVIHASQGALFRAKWALVSVGEVERLAEEARGVWIADAGGGVVFWEAELAKAKSLIVVGAEHAGVPEQLKALPTAQRVHIPMAGGVDSLNAAVSCALLMYEVSRQRGQ